MRYQLILTIIQGSAITLVLSDKETEAQRSGVKFPRGRGWTGIPGQCCAPGSPQEKDREDGRMEQGKKPWENVISAGDRSRMEHGEKRHLGRGPASAWDHRGLWGMLHRPWSHLKASALALPPRASSVPGCMLPWVGTRWDVQAPGHGGPSWPSVSRGQLCL